MNQSATNRPPFVFDGCGINGPDEYASRLATLTDAGHRYGIGPLMADALNHDASTLKTQAAQIEELRGALNWLARKVEASGIAEDDGEPNEVAEALANARALLSNLPAAPSDALRDAAQAVIDHRKHNHLDNQTAPYAGLVAALNA